MPLAVMTSVAAKRGRAKAGSERHRADGERAASLRAGCFVDSDDAGRKQRQRGESARDFDDPESSFSSFTSSRLRFFLVAVKSHDEREATAASAPAIGHGKSTR